MQRASLSVLVLVGLVTVAGRNAFSSGSDTPMVTPMDVPTDEPTPMPPPKSIRQLSSQCISSLPELGFANASVLAAAHNRTLQNTSFTVSNVHTEVYLNGSRAYYRKDIRVSENHSQSYLILESLGPSTRYERVEIWTNGKRVVKRSISGYNANYNTRVETGSGRFPLFAGYYASLPDAILDNASACVVDQFTYDDTTLFVVSFTTTEPLYTDPNATIIRNVTGRALVNESGIIHEIRWDYAVRTADGTKVYVTESTYYTDIGSTTVERPVWYGKVVNQTTAGA